MSTNPQLLTIEQITARWNELHDGQQAGKAAVIAGQMTGMQFCQQTVYVAAELRELQMEAGILGLSLTMGEKVGRDEAR